MMKIQVLALCVAAIAACTPSVSVSSPEPATSATQVNGTWQGKTGTFKVWTLPDQKIQVEFFGTYESNTPLGKIANIGEASGVAMLSNTTAIFEPNSTRSSCTITMNFDPAILQVTESGKCGFGLNVTSKGTYTQISSEKPKFKDHKTRAKELRTELILIIGRSCSVIPPS